MSALTAIGRLVVPMELRAAAKLVAAVHGTFLHSEFDRLGAIVGVPIINIVVILP